MRKETGGWGGGGAKKGGDRRLKWICSFKKIYIEEYKTILKNFSTYILCILYAHMFKKNHCSLIFEGFYTSPIYLPDFDYSFDLISFPVFFLNYD